jgi:MFS family permease
MDNSKDGDRTQPQKIKEIDRIINNYGYGWITWKTYFITVLITAMEGFHFTFFGNMIIPLKQYYQMSDHEVELINSIFFLSVGLGSVSSGYLSERFRRIRIIATMVFLIAVCHLVLGFVTNMIVFAILRLLLALFHGIAVPISINLLAEYLPVRFRAVMLTTAWLGFVIGQMLNLLLILIIMPDYETERYPETILYSSGLSIFAFLMIILFINDSPRNLLSMGDTDKAFTILKQLNGNELTDIQREKILDERNSGVNIELKASLGEIFNPKLRRVSILLILIWMINSLLLYGPNLIAPLTMKELGDPAEEVVINQIIIVLISSPCDIVGGIMSEIPFLGRSKTCMISLVLMVVANLLMIFDSHNFEFYIGVYFFLINIAFNINNTFSCEVYPTKVRDLAIGFLFFCTRIGGFVSQIIFMEFNEYGTWIPYYVVIGLCCLNVLIIMMLPFDTRARELDFDDTKKDPLTIL